MYHTVLVFLVNEEEYFNTMPQVEGGEGKPLKVCPMQLSHFTRGTSAHVHVLSSVRTIYW
jgi:hypothetical protein